MMSKPLLVAEKEDDYKKKKTLYIVMSSEYRDPVVGYSVLSVTHTDLFAPPTSPFWSSSSSEQPSPSKVAKVSSSSSPSPPGTLMIDQCYHHVNEEWNSTLTDDEGDMGAGVGVGMLGSKIYFVRGYYHTATKAFVYDTVSHSLDKLSVKDMAARKERPFVLAIKNEKQEEEDEEELFYVLPSQHHRPHPLHVPAFEAYHPLKNIWKPLATPPFLDPASRYCLYPDVSCFLVVRNRFIWVSTRYCAFSYDVENDTWTGCFLFDQYRLPIHGALDLDGFYSPIRPFAPEKSTAGSPFDIFGPAVLFDRDVLICVCFDSFEITAYHIDYNDATGSGLVLRRQRLNGVRVQGVYSGSYIADLGGGHFCLVSASHTSRFGEVDTLTNTLTPFRVRKKPNFSDEDDFLSYGIGQLLETRRFTGGLSKIWLPIGCCAL